MVRHSVLVVDPDPRRRAQLLLHLSLDFEVTVVPSATDALLHFETLQPDIVAASVFQDTGSGFRLCRMLREQLHAERCYLMVYGRPSRRLRSSELVQQRWRLDCYLPTDPEPSAVVALLRHGLAVREIQRRLALAASSLSVSSDGGGEAASEPSLNGLPSMPFLPPRLRWQIRARVLRVRLKALLTREYYLFPPPPKSASSLAELSWLQLLNSRVSLEQLRELIKRFYLRRFSGTL